MKTLSPAFITLARTVWTKRTLQETAQLLLVAGYLTGSKTELISAFNDAIKAKAWAVVKTILDLNVIPVTSHQLTTIIQHQPNLVKGRLDLLEVATAGQIVTICDLHTAMDYISSNITKRIWQDKPDFFKLPFSQDQLIKILAQDLSYKLRRAIPIELRINAIIANQDKPLESRTKISPGNIFQYLHHFPSRTIQSLIDDETFPITVERAASNHQLIPYLPDTIVESEAFLTSVINLSDKPTIIEFLNCIKTSGITFTKAHYLTSGLRLGSRNATILGLTSSLFSTQPVQAKQLLQSLLQNPTFGQLLFQNLYYYYTDKTIHQLLPLFLALDKPRSYLYDFHTKLIVSNWKYAPDTALDDIIKLGKAIDPVKGFNQKLAGISFKQIHFEKLGIKPTKQHLTMALKENDPVALLYLLKTLKLSNEDIEATLFNALKFSANNALAAMRPFIPQENIDSYNEILALFSTEADEELDATTAD